VNTYSVIQSERVDGPEFSRESVVESGLTLKAARAAQASRDAAERLLNPGASSWTAKIHTLQLEQPSTVAVELVEAARCALSVLYLLSDEVKGLGCGGDRVVSRLRAAVDRADAVCKGGQS
jgi:hypothetical protein